jgi:hypothetical protein
MFRSVPLFFKGVGKEIASVPLFPSSSEKQGYVVLSPLL